MRFFKLGEVITIFNSNNICLFVSVLNISLQNIYFKLKRSKNSEEILTIIATSRKTPSEIVGIMDARFSLVSTLLTDLKSQGIIFCINEDDNTGRFIPLGAVKKLRIPNFLKVGGSSTVCLLISDIASLNINCLFLFSVSV